VSKQGARQAVEHSRTIRQTTRCGGNAYLRNRDAQTLGLGGISSCFSTGSNARIISASTYNIQKRLFSASALEPGDLDKDYYAILGVPDTATTEEIKAKFRKLAFELHPDRTQNNPKAAEKFKIVSHAYQLLTDPNTRQEYDAYRRYAQGGPGSFFRQPGANAGSQRKSTSSQYDYQQEFYARPHPQQQPPNYADPFGPFLRSEQMTKMFTGMFGQIPVDVILQQLEQMLKREREDMARKRQRDGRSSSSEQEEKEELDKKMWEHLFNSRFTNRYTSESQSVFEEVYTNDNGERILRTTVRSKDMFGKVQTQVFEQPVVGGKDDFRMFTNVMHGGLRARLGELVKYVGSMVLAYSLSFVMELFRRVVRNVLRRATGGGRG